MIENADAGAAGVRCAAAAARVREHFAWPVIAAAPGLLRRILADTTALALTCPEPALPWLSFASTGLEDWPSMDLVADQLLRAPARRARNRRGGRCAHCSGACSSGCRSWGRKHAAFNADRLV